MLSLFILLVIASVLFALLFFKSDSAELLPHQYTVVYVCNSAPALLAVFASRSCRQKFAVAFLQRRKCCQALNAAESPRAVFGDSNLVLVLCVLLQLSVPVG